MQRLWSVAAAVALALSTASCGDSPLPDDPYVSAVSGLCDASTRAEMGELDLARQAFYDTAHRPLHDLAAEVAGVDRGLAARLLEAKESRSKVKSFLSLFMMRGSSQGWTESHQPHLSTQGGPAAAGRVEDHRPGRRIVSRGCGY